MPGCPPLAGRGGPPGRRTDLLQALVEGHAAAGRLGSGSPPRGGPRPRAPLPPSQGRRRLAKAVAQHCKWRGRLGGVRGRHRHPGGAFRHVWTVLALSLPPMAPSESPNGPAQHCRWPCAAQLRAGRAPLGGAAGGKAVFVGDGGGWSLTYYPFGHAGLPLAPSGRPRARLYAPPNGSLENGPPNPAPESREEEEEMERLELPDQATQGPWWSPLCNPHPAPTSPSNLTQPRAADRSVSGG